MSESKGFLLHMLAGGLLLVTALAAEFWAQAAENFAALLGRALDPLHPQGHAATVDLLKLIMDLSRIYAALIAHLGCLAFESQGAFASQR